MSSGILSTMKAMSQTGQALLMNDLKFECQTYNAVSIIREQNTSYVNASRMCSDNGKKWRQYRQSKQWKQIEQNAKKYIQAPEKLVRLNLDGPLGALEFDINTGSNEFRGTYIHPKLIHFVAEYVNIEYAFQVAELMDSINNSVHEQLQQKQLPDTPENTKPIFETTTQQITSSLRIVSDIENQQCYGIRERDKFDYLDSWTKDDVKRLFEDFKNKLHQQLGFVYNDVKIDYPQLFD